ncbi:HAD family phosphatase [Candidatus Woesearchaeota archaeon]|nr:HAD family phosphatase [Candidatus Woesearchaeota archaeon]
MIKTLIFDFAGVITTAALFPRVAEILGSRTGIGKKAFHKRLKVHEPEYLLGHCTTREFWKAVCKGTDISYPEFATEISSYQLNEEMLDLIKKLKDEYQIILLSDNYDALLRAMSKDRKLQGVFDHVYYSHQLHMVKMYDGDKIFNQVLKKIKANPNECVFVDDKEINLIAAKGLGIQTILFRNINQLKEELAELGVKVQH